MEINIQGGKKENWVLNMPVLNLFVYVCTSVQGNQSFKKNKKNNSARISHKLNVKMWPVVEMKPDISEIIQQCCSSKEFFFFNHFHAHKRAEQANALSA